MEATNNSSPQQKRNLKLGSLRDSLKGLPILKKMTHSL